MEQIRCTRVGAGAGFDHLSYVPVARNWASSSGKLAVYSSFTMHMYSGLSFPTLPDSLDARTAFRLPLHLWLGMCIGDLGWGPRTRHLVLF